MQILITDKIADEAMDILGKEHEVFFDEMDHESLIREIPNYNALIVRSRTKVGKDVVENAKKMIVIGRAGIGVDNIDVDEASKRGIKVVNAPTGATISVAELAIAHMLSLSRHIPYADGTMKRGIWEKKKLMGKELFGKTLALIGSGRIAQHVSHIANGLGMKVLVYSPHITEEKASKMGATMIKDVKELVKKADFVSLHIPHTPETHYLVDRDFLSWMKPTAFLINCARGGVVDENALYDALKEKKIAGTALDVFEKEPPGESPLLNLDNIVFTPHLGASTKEGQRRAGIICAEQVLMALDGKEPEFWVNKKMMR
jgi:D-3-phosphoglycerate dehydrogenase